MAVTKNQVKKHLKEQLSLSRKEKIKRELDAYETVIDALLLFGEEFVHYFGEFYHEPEFINELRRRYKDYQVIWVSCVYGTGVLGGKVCSYLCFR